MNRASSLTILGIIVVIIGGLVWLFAGGDPAPATTNDPAGDVVVGRGPRPPKQPRLVDVTDASVHLDGSTAVFEATVVKQLSTSFEREAATFRWELSENGNVTWIVSAAVDIEGTASLAATQFDYRSSTIDDTLPGELEISGRTIRIAMDTDRLERFPSAFDWKLKTELDGDRNKAPSALARDVVPNEGSLRAAS